MIRAVFITNIPSPYRVDFFAFLQKNYPEYEFHIIFSGAGMENRKWIHSASPGYRLCDGV